MTRSVENENATAASVEWFVAQVLETVDRHHMLVRGDRVLVAVSGGPDSVALWRVLECLAEKRRLALAMAHVNYHLRGEDSEKDEAFCRKLAQQSGARFHVHSRRPPRSPHRTFNLQDWARRERYAIFASLCARENYRRIAVGHHYDDQVETVVVGLLSGRESFALTGMPRARGRIIRPLFDCRRTEILDFLRRLGQSYREDRSNRDCRFLRNRVRHEVLPRWREEFNPRIDAVLFRWAEFAAEQQSLLTGIVERQLKKAVTGWGHEWVTFNRTKLRRMDRRLDFHVLRHMGQGLTVRVGRVPIPACGGERNPTNDFSDPLSVSPEAPSGSLVARFGDLVAIGRSGTKLVWGRTVIECSATEVVFCYGRLAAAEPVEIALEGATQAKAWGVVVTCRRRARATTNTVRLPRGAWRLYADARAIHPPLVLRAARLGERIRPLGMAGQRRVFDILAEAGVPAALRPAAPVMQDREGVIWIVGRHQDHRVKVTPDTRELLQIEIRHLQEEIE